MSPVIYFEKGFTDRRLDKGFRSGTGPILVADRYPELFFNNKTLRIEFGSVDDKPVYKR